MLCKANLTDRHGPHLGPDRNLKTLDPKQQRPALHVALSCKAHHRPVPSGKHLLHLGLQLQQLGLILLLSQFADHGIGGLHIKGISNGIGDCQLQGVDCLLCRLLEVAAVQLVAQVTQAVAGGKGLGCPLIIQLQCSREVSVTTAAYWQADSRVGWPGLCSSASMSMSRSERAALLQVGRVSAAQASVSCIAQAASASICGAKAGACVSGWSGGPVVTPRCGEEAAAVSTLQRSSLGCRQAWRAAMRELV